MTTAGRTVLSAAAALLAIAPPAAPQEMDHAAHMMGGMAGGWRMPPMDPNMPMIPGLEMALPPVEPFLAAAGIDLMTLPEARPSEAVHLEPGDTFDVDVTIVRRTLNGHMSAMYGYNGQYPGPLIRARQGSTVVVRGFIPWGREAPTHALPIVRSMEMVFSWRCRTRGSGWCTVISPSICTRG